VVRSRRAVPVASGGGSTASAWTLEAGRENPHLENWGQLLEPSREHDAVISLGGALRPGATADALDEFQVGGLPLKAKPARETWRAARY
jgi:phosphomethylpyrimidine synthase